MKIRVNEKPARVPDVYCAADAVARFRPRADIVILNALPLAKPYSEKLSEGDSLVLITRGEKPSPREFEAMLCARHSAGVHDRLKNSVVGIAGAGGIGSHCALCLARMGVGTLVIADFDVVEPSNLNRQIYYADQLGMPKVAALKETLKRANPYVKITALHKRLDEKNTAPLFKKVDVFIEAFDQPSEKTKIVSSFVKARPATPVIMVSGLAGCGPADALRTSALGGKLYVIGDLETGIRQGTGLMSPRVMVAAGMQANLAVRLLLGLQ
ncbi:MAG: sulfur carrier protein ThiS adenylyltransferase ThiF [Elusimicrobiaceae bacterium]